MSAGAPKLRQLPPAADERPLIRLGPELHETVDAALRALEADPNLYQRGGLLVQLARPAGDAPVIRPVTVATMRERLAAVARWERFNAREEEWYRCLPPDNVCSAVLDRGSRPGVRPVVGVLEAPSLRPDGTIIQQPGYDAATGYYFEPNGLFPVVPPRPTPAQGRASLMALTEPFAEFQWRADADLYAAITAILTLVARPAIEGSVPAIMFGATTPGSGKTLAADAAVIIATGRSAAKMSFPEDDEELEKVLGSVALAGDATVFFDDIKRPFGGGPVDKVLTSDDTVKMRILGRSETPSLRWRALMIGTGCNLTWQGHTSRRVLVPQMEPDVENPEERSGYKIDNLRAWAREHRARLVVAALTLLRAFILDGAPRGTCRPWGSFEAWSALIPPAIVWAGGEDPMACRPSADTDARDEERASVSVLLEAIARLTREVPEGITARTIIDRLYPERSRGDGPAPPDGYDDAREAIEALTGSAGGKKPNANRLGYVLRAWRRRVIGDRRLDATADRRGIARWVVRGRGDS